MNKAFGIVLVAVMLTTAMFACQPTTERQEALEEAGATDVATLRTPWSTFTESKSDLTEFYRMCAAYLRDNPNPSPNEPMNAAGTATRRAECVEYMNAYEEEFGGAP